jgi:hypothetical protein
MGDRDFIFFKSPPADEKIGIIVSERSFRTARWFQSSNKNFYALLSQHSPLTSSENQQGAHY